MSNIFKELPIVFPFYENHKQKDINKENVESICAFKLISPKNALLPFQIEIPKDKANPISWKIIGINGSEIDISNNLNKIKIYVFEEKKQAVYFGEELNFVYGSRNEPLNLQNGFYYTIFNFSDGTYYVSDVFFAAGFNVGANTEFMQVDFWQDKDVEPLIFRNGWKQTIYLSTFVHSAIPEVEEETEKDGFNSEIPTFQRMVLKYKFVELVPDFIKIALVSLQMQDNVYISLSDKRSGKIDRVSVESQPDETIGLNNVEVIFEDDVLIKTACGENKQEISQATW